MSGNNKGAFKSLWLTWPSLALMLLGFSYHLSANAVDSLQPCSETVGHFASIEGTVEIQRIGSSHWHPANPDIKLCENDSIRVGKYSRAAVSLINEAVLRLKQNAAISS